MKTPYLVLGWLCLQAAIVSVPAASAPVYPPSPESSGLKASRENIIQHSSDPAAQKEHAQLCLKEHLEAEALMAASAAHNLAPNDAEATRLYVTALARNGKYQEALDANTGDKEIKDVIEAATLALQAEEKMQHASEGGKRDAYLEVATLLEKAIASDPDNLSIRLTLAWVYLDKLGDARTAYPRAQIVARDHPQDLNARRLLASASVQTGHLTQALEEFRQASLLRPGDPWIQANLGRTLAKLGHYEEAEKIFADVLAKDPANADARLGQAELAAWRGHTTEALEQVSGLLKENPGNVEALQLRGDIHRWNWQLSQAEMDYQDVLSTAKDHPGAIAGIEEAKRMGASDLSVKAYEFTDDTSFRRQSITAGTRIHLADKVYLRAGGAGWRFHQNGVGDLDRVDGMAGLELHPSRRVEILAEGDVFKYENRDTFVGAQGALKLSPTSQWDLYLSGGYNQPFVSSMATVTNGLRQDLAGVGLDIRLGRRFSFQNGFQVARISDDNAWLEEKPRLSYRLFGQTYLRAEYDFLTYQDFNASYWTPFHRHTLAPVLDTSIPLGKCFHINLGGSAPYIFSESEFGYQLTAGAVLDLARWLQLTGTYYNSSIPGDQGAWSGDGWEAALRLVF